MSIASLALLLALAAHPDSLSSSRITVLGHEVHLALRCQIRSLLEVIPGLDADGNGLVTTDEVEAKRGEILAYVADHYRVRVGTDRELEGGEQLVPEAMSLRHNLPGSVQDIGFREGGLDVEMRFRSSSPVRDLMLEVTLFHTTSPTHVDLATIVWDADTSESFGITRSDPRVRSDPTGRGAFKVFVVLGFRHILGGWDHIAFVVALLLGTRSLKALLWVVTAFTVAHSVTLGLAATGVVDTARHTRLVEIVIALSIAYVAADNLVHPRVARSRWIEAFVFGLVHGLGFAGFLAQSLVREPAKATALVAFNVGVELGQLLVVLASLVLLWMFVRRRPSSPAEPAFLAPLLVRRVGSAAVAVLGLYWFVQRI